jgi:hypothetical protein
MARSALLVPTLATVWALGCGGNATGSTASSAAGSSSSSGASSGANSRLDASIVSDATGGPDGCAMQPCGAPAAPAADAAVPACPETAPAMHHACAQPQACAYGSTCAFCAPSHPDPNGGLVFVPAFANAGFNPLQCDGGPASCAWGAMPLQPNPSLCPMSPPAWNDSCSYVTTGSSTGFSPGCVGSCFYCTPGGLVQALCENGNDVCEWHLSIASH